MRRWNLLVLAVAGVVLFSLLRGIDWDTLLRSFWRGARYWPLLLVPYAFSCLFWTLSWKSLLAGVPGAPGLRRLFLLRLAGESLNQLTPAASLGGEPFKALRLHALGVSWPSATASLVIHKALMVASLVLYIILALALVPYVLPGLPPAVVWFSYLGTSTLALGAATFLLLQRHNPCSQLLRLSTRWGVCPAFLKVRLPECAAVDAALGEFYRSRAGAGLRALAWYLAGWLCHAGEVCVIFWLLGHPVELDLALCLDALAQLVAALGFMVPVSLGVQDGGNILLSLGFKLGSTLGAGFSILRRFREGCWLLLGLLAAARGK